MLTAIPTKLMMSTDADRALELLFSTTMHQYVGPQSSKMRLKHLQLRQKSLLMHPVHMNQSDKAHFIQTFLHCVTSKYSLPRQLRLHQLDSRSTRTGKCQARRGSAPPCPLMRHGKINQDSIHPNREKQS